MSSILLEEGDTGGFKHSLSGKPGLPALFRPIDRTAKNVRTFCQILRFICGYPVDLKRFLVYDKRKQHKTTKNNIFKKTQRKK